MWGRKEIEQKSMKKEIEQKSMKKEIEQKSMKKEIEKDYDSNLRENEGRRERERWREGDG